MKQQWELLASEGHVLLARVNVYRRKVNSAYAVAGFGVLFSFALAYPAANYIGNAAGGVVGWISEKAGSMWVKDISKSPAPNVSSFRAAVPYGFSVTRDLLADLNTQVLPEMQSVLSKINAGSKFEDCDFSAKITDNWATKDSVIPHCRYSKDGNRLWVWSLVLHDNSLQSWVGVFYRNDTKSKFQLRQIGYSGLARASQVEVLLANRIPRTIAADFPELVKGE